MLTYLSVAFLWVVVIKCLQLEPSWDRLPIKVKFDERIKVGTAVLQFFRFKESWLILMTVPLAILARCQIAHPLFWLDAALGAIPFLIWPLVEWITHVFVLHRFPKSTLYRDHAEHHKRPAIAQSSLNRPYTTATYWLIIWSLWYWQLPALCTFWISSMVMMTVYEIFHFITHSPCDLRSSWLRRRVANHRRHHWVAEETCFGVLTLSADRILGTDRNANN